MTFASVDRVHRYYIENNQKFTWLHNWKNNIFIYGNPFGHYSF